CGLFLLINRKFTENSNEMLIFAKRRYDMFIHDTENWTSFRWNADTLSDVSFLFCYFLRSGFIA
ncbi:hypothetical protein, partial [Bacteroides faecis]|uniref:hypothetical protein n=2 Tax=Bacteroides faecis TaxID=674529 RepID=UPI001E4A87D4